MNPWLRGGYLTAIYGFLYLPVAVLIAQSFNASKYGLTWGGFSFKWYAKLLDSAMLMEAAANSLLVAATSATFATIIGTLAALALFRYRFRGRSLVQGLVFVVMMQADIVMGIALLVLFVAIQLPLGFTTLLIAHTTVALPFVVVTVHARLAGFDPHLVEAARDLGCDEWQGFRRVVLPLAWPAVAAGWLLAFTLSLDDVIIAFFVTGPSFEVLPLKIYSMVRLGVKPEVNALSTVIVLFSLVLVLLAQWLLRRKE